MGFKDYLGRKLVMEKETFKDHTQGHYLNENEKRHQLFPHIKEVLKKPDEVWLSLTEKGFTKKYVSFYKDRALVVKTRLNPSKNKLSISSWYNMKREKGELDTRNGLKIK